jgi:hypothetical protein
MTNTRVDLCQQVLVALGKAVDNDDPVTEDMLCVDRFVDSVVASLSRRDIYTVNDPGAAELTGGAIEDEIFLDLADCIAFRAASAFGIAGQQLADLAALASSAENRMRTIAAPPRTLPRLRIDPALVNRRRGLIL